MPVESRDDLVKRLREWAVYIRVGKTVAALLVKAATRIESDAKRIAELEAERDWLVSSGHKQGAQIADSVVVEIADAVAEERERCASIADAFADQCDIEAIVSPVIEQVEALRSKEQAANEIATAIRSGKPDGKE